MTTNNTPQTDESPADQTADSNEDTTMTTNNTARDRIEAQYSDYERAQAAENGVDPVEVYIAQKESQDALSEMRKARERARRGASGDYDHLDVEVGGHTLWAHRTIDALVDREKSFDDIVAAYNEGHHQTKNDDRIVFPSKTTAYVWMTKLYGQFSDGAWENYAWEYGGWERWHKLSVAVDESLDTPVIESRKSFDNIDVYEEMTKFGVGSTVQRVRIGLGLDGTGDDGYTIEDYCNDLQTIEDGVHAAKGDRSGEHWF